MIQNCVVWPNSLGSEASHITHDIIFIIVKLQ